jgi:putative Holliday junction resolvase
VPRARILALDLGTRRIGLAVSDELGITAQGLPSLQRTNLRSDLEALARLIDQYKVGLVLAGNPMHMSGRESPGTARAREFAARLHARTGVDVQLWDERLTTREAGRVLRESGVGIRKRAQVVDRLSAVLLLASYLDSCS